MQIHLEIKLHRLNKPMVLLHTNRLNTTLQPMFCDIREKNNMNMSQNFKSYFSRGFKDINTRHKDELLATINVIFVT